MKDSYKKTLKYISDEELGDAWLKIKKNPDEMLKRLEERGTTLLYDFVLTLYCRNIINSKDWVLIEHYIDFARLFRELMLDKRTKNRFRSDVSGLFDQVIRDSKAFWQDYWDEPILGLDHLPKFSFAPDRVIIPAVPEKTLEGHASASDPVSTHFHSRKAHPQFSMWKPQRV